MTIEEALDEFESVQEQWVERCLECKHAYKRKDDDDTLWCRLRKRKCPHLAERKDEYVTLHHEDIHFNSEEDEKAFYEALAEIKNTRSFTAEEWEFYKKVNREKMQKTGLNIRDFMGEERKEE